MKTYSKAKFLGLDFLIQTTPLHCKFSKVGVYFLPWHGSSCHNIIFFSVWYTVAQLSTMKNGPFQANGRHKRRRAMDETETLQYVAVDKGVKDGLLSKVYFSQEGKK